MKWARPGRRARRWPPPCSNILIWTPPCAARRCGSSATPAAAEAPDPLTERVCARLDAAAPGPLALGFSGGGDSTALLLLAADWARARGRALHAFVVDHGLQPGSAETAARAAAFAQNLGVEARVLLWRGAKPATGLQAAARQARHRLLAQASADAGAHTLLLAHTLDDQAETVWLRLAAGSAWRGLAAMRMAAPSPVWPPPVRRDGPHDDARGLTLFRPLLDVTRADLRAYLARAGVSWTEDPANIDPRFARTRARIALYRAGPGATAKLVAIARHARALADAEDAAALALWRAHGRALWDGTLRIAADALTGPGAPRLFQVMLTAASGAAREPAAEAAARALETLRTEKAVTLGGAAAVTRRSEIVVHRDPGALLGRAGVPAAAPVTLRPGEDTVWDGRFLIRAGPAPLRVAPLGEAWKALDAAGRAALADTPEAARGALPAADGRLLDAAPLPAARLRRLLFAGAAWFDASADMQNMR